MSPTCKLVSFLVAAMAATSFAQPAAGPAADPPAKAPEKELKPGEIEIKVDTTDAPELAEYGERIKKLSEEWYPKLQKMLPSEGYTAPQRVVITFKKGIQPPAMASGNRITCKVEWF